MLRCLSSFIYIVILLLVCWIRLVSNYFGLIKVNGIQKLKVKGRNIQRWYKTIEHGAECKRLAKHILTKNSWVRAGDHESTFGPAHQEHCGVDQRVCFLFFFVCFFLSLSLSLSFFLFVCLFVCLSCFISVSLSLSLCGLGSLASLSPAVLVSNADELWGLRVLFHTGSERQAREKDISFV